MAHEQSDYVHQWEIASARLHQSNRTSLGHTDLLVISSEALIEFYSQRWSLEEIGGGEVRMDINQADSSPASLFHLAQQ